MMDNRFQISGQVPRCLQAETFPVLLSREALRKRQRSEASAAFPQAAGRDSHRATALGLPPIGSRPGSSGLRHQHSNLTITHSILLLITGPSPKNEGNRKLTTFTESKVGFLKGLSRLAVQFTLLIALPLCKSIC